MTQDTSAPDCPVCRTSQTTLMLTVGEGGKGYWACPCCEARFLDPTLRPDPAAEHAHYLHHENDPADPRYRRFLSKLFDPFAAKLKPNAVLLDYGCGPGPALALMLREAGHQVALYDPFFAPDTAPLSGTYDGIVCTETAEHFHNPACEFARLDGLLKPGGWLGLMTCFQTDDARFANWHYRMDPTHVVFYREATLRWVAQHHRWSCEIPAKDVVLMRKDG